MHWRRYFTKCFLFVVLQIGLFMMRITSQDIPSVNNSTPLPSSTSVASIHAFSCHTRILVIIPIVHLLSRPEGHSELLVSAWNNVCCDAGQDTGKQHQTDNPIRIKRFLSLGNPGIEHDPDRPITIYLPVPLTLWCSRNI